MLKVKAARLLMAVMVITSVVMVCGGAVPAGVSWT